MIIRFNYKMGCFKKRQPILLLCVGVKQLTASGIVYFHGVKQLFY